MFCGLPRSAGVFGAELRNRLANTFTGQVSAGGGTGPDDCAVDPAEQCAGQPFSVANQGVSVEVAQPVHAWNVMVRRAVDSELQRCLGHL
jgi:hypothetical protein